VLTSVGDVRRWPDFEVNAGGGELGHQQVRRQRVSRGGGVGLRAARRDRARRRLGRGLYRAQTGGSGVDSWPCPPWTLATAGVGARMG
jgi:hypothetical protein